MADSDSDIELMAPRTYKQHHVAAAPSLHLDASKPRPVASAGPGPPTSSSSFGLPPPLPGTTAADRPTLTKDGKTAPSNIIEIDSEGDEEDYAPRVASTSASKLTIPPKRVTSAPTNLYASTSGMGTMKRSSGSEFYDPVFDDDDDEEEDRLPDISDAIASRRTASESLSASGRLDKGKGREIVELLTPPSDRILHDFDRAGALQKSFAYGGAAFGLDQSARNGKTAAVRSTSLRSYGSADSNDDDDGPAKKRKKVTPADKSVSPILTKTQQKELDRATKRAEKEREKAEKAAIAAREKEEKNAFKGSNIKLNRQTACQELSVVVSAPLMQDSFFKGKIWTDVSARLNELRCEHAQPNNAPPATKGCFDKIIHFNRRHTKDWDAKARYWVPRRPEEYTTEEESTVLLFMSGQEVEAAVGRRKAGRSDGTLVDIITKVKQSHGYHYQVFVLVQNLQQKAKVRAKQTKERWDAVAAGTSAAQSQPKGKGKDQGWDPSISFEEVQQELVTLTVAERCFVLRAETPSEAIDWLVDITKDLAYKPYKLIERAREALLNIDGKIESTNGGNLLTTYTNQLACIHGVTMPTARAIAAKFPSWRRLLDAYKACPTESDKKELLSGIAIGNKINGAATDRTIGKALSERVYIVLFTHDPNLDLTGDLKEVRARMA